MVIRKYAKETLSGTFTRSVALVISPEDEWAVCEWLDLEESTPVTYYHNSLVDAMWNIEWWHTSNESHGYKLVDTIRS